MSKEDSAKNKKDKKKIIDSILVTVVALVISISVIANFLSLLYTIELSQEIDIIKNTVTANKTNSYDEGSLSFFSNKIEATKKDTRTEGRIEGELINKSGQRINEATIYFKIYDENGNLIDWSADSIRNWDSGETWIYNAPISENSVKYEFAEFDIAY